MEHITRTVDDLFYIMRTSMPRPDVGSLSEKAYIDLLAYLLASNGIKSGRSRLSADPQVLSKICLTTVSDNEAETTATKRHFFTGDGDIKPKGTGPSANELANAAQSTDWLYHTGNFKGTRYTTLDQINRDNVSDLRVACLYQLGGP